LKRLFNQANSSEYPIPIGLQNACSRCHTIINNKSQPQITQLHTRRNARVQNKPYIEG